LSWRWRGCAVWPTPPDHHCRTARAPTPDRASASLPGHARPAVSALAIASNRLPRRPDLPPAHPPPRQTDLTSTPARQEFRRRWIQAKDAVARSLAVTSGFRCRYRGLLSSCLPAENLSANRVYRPCPPVVAARRPASVAEGARVRVSVKRAIRARSTADVRMRLDRVPAQRWHAESLHATLRPGRLIGQINLAPRQGTFASLGDPD
jgi:hypothetical protein